jgi:hypothetical protein
MRADSVARLTVASCTPGTFFSARSTRDEQDAQVMPPMPISSEGEVVSGVFMVRSVVLPTMARSSACQSTFKTIAHHDHFTLGRAENCQKYTLRTGP